MEGSELNQVVVVLEEPVLNDENISYTVKIVSGDMPEKGSEVSVDVIGMPLNTVSYAGAARRTYRRAVWY